VDALDNAVWHTLTGPLADFAQTRPEPDPSAARFLPEVSPFAAIDDPADPSSWAALGALAGPGGVAVLLRSEIDLAPGWTVLESGVGLQMLGDDVEGRPDPDAIELGPDDVGEMLELIGRTRPGPFAARTVEVGRYVGLRVDDRLVAMAGERMRFDGCVEVSAVCTDPEQRGRGLAARLVRDVVAGIVESGHRAVLHVAADNTGAQRLYGQLGFRPRREVQVRVVQAPGLQA
jgi:ribosomal protein S18 acetylase RimI-like enzyme